MFIIQQCNGTEPGETKVFQKKQLDEEHSAIWAGSTYIQRDDKGNRVERSKPSDDKMVLGYTYDGLPFMIVVDGMFGCERNPVFDFIDKSVTPFIDNYAQNLAVSDNPAEVTKSFIEALRANRPGDQSIDFTLSIAVTYERNGKLQCSGFGIGDTAIALKRSTGKVEQLVYNNQVNNFKDAFDDATSRYSADELIQKTSFETILHQFHVVNCSN